MGNSTCPAVDRAPIDPVPFYSDGNLNFKAHDVGWIVCGFFSCVATIASVWLIWKHLTYYTCPQQQRHYVRILFMVPIYAILTTLSYIFFNESIYYTTVCDCYEAVVITSFFNLLLQYVGDTPSEQLEVFRQVKFEKWFFPLNYWRYRPDGVHFLWLMKICILQYAVLQPICTLVAVGLQYYGLYCLESWEPYFGHMWISLIVAISISIAMYCIIQIYLPIKEELKPYKPVLKFLAIKSIIFLTFWQDSFLSVLIYFKIIKQTKYFTTGDIQIGINALMVTFEMMFFSFLHIKAFTYVIYRPQDKCRTTRQGKALLDVLDFRDWYYDMMNTTRYVAARGRGRDFTIADDIRNQKNIHLEKALGRDRLLHLKAERENDKKKMPTFWKDDRIGTEKEGELLFQSVDLEKYEESDALDEDNLVARGDRAMQADYDVEDGERELGAEAIGGHVREPDEPILPTLPFAFKVRNAAVPRTEADAGQPNRYHHLTTIEGVEDGHLDDSSDVVIARKGEQHEKEASLGLGAWWRAFRERVSGGSIDETTHPRHPREDDYEEKTGMLAEELRRGIDCNTGNDIEKKKRPPLIRGMRSTSVSFNVLQGRNSPLSLLINSQGQKEGIGQDKLVIPRVIDNDGLLPVISDGNRTMTRHVSTKAALEEREADASQGQSIEPSSSYGPTQELMIGAPSLIAIDHVNTQTALRSSGPKGKSISLILPTRLSKGKEHFTPAPARCEHTPMSIVNSAANASVRSKHSILSAKISVFEIKPPSRRSPEDDPEAESINRAGTVVAGAQSYNARQRQRQDLQVEQNERKKAQPGLIEHHKEVVPSWRDSGATSVVPEPYTPLPAPSQMAQMDKPQDPFAAALTDSCPSKGAVRGSVDTRSWAARQINTATTGRTDRPTIEVGSIISHQGVLEWTRPSQSQDLQLYGYRRAGYPRNRFPPNPIQEPDYQRQDQHQRPAPRKLRHSTGTTRPPPGVAQYDRYTGEPSWQPQASYERQSRVESRRQIYEAPPGFHFDYID